MTVGRVVLVAGVLILLFVGYLLWGTGLKTARSQARLRTEFANAERQVDRSPPTTLGNRPLRRTGGLRIAPRIPAPPAGGPVGTINIPKIGLSMVVVQGTGTDQLEQGPGHYPGTPLPGERGNSAIAGHRTTYLHPFYNLNELAQGDPITVITVQGIFQYDVASMQAVLPSDVSVVRPTRWPTLTLTTCNPRFSASQRLVVHAVLVASILASTKPHPKPAPTKAPQAHPSTPAPATPTQDWTAAILWGLVVAALAIVAWTWERRCRGTRRAAVAVGGLIAWLVVVFFFFQAAAPLLPASY
jgi:sortase A